MRAFSGLFTHVPIFTRSFCALYQENLCGIHPSIVNSINLLLVTQGISLRRMHNDASFAFAFTSVALFDHLTFLTPCISYQNIIIKKYYQELGIDALCLT